MELNLRNVLIAFLFSLFMGVTAIAIGAGAAYPPINYIAAPVVCPDGQMTVESTVYNPYPGRWITTRDWYCTDPSTGVKRSLNFFEMDLVSGLVYGLALFVVIVLLWWLVPKLRASARGGAAAERQAQTDPVLAAFEELKKPYVRGAVGMDDAQVAQLEEMVRQARSAGGAAISGNAARRLKELENLRASNLINQAEYEKKRAEILKSL